ncbi:hypothetical protein GX586_13545, partial [bacterium]|nr:hypothetical protein [bacterium]
IFPDGLAGSVVAKAGGIGGVDGTMIKSVSATRGKIKDVVTKQSATTGGDIGGKYYPGGYGQIRAFGADRKGVSIKKVSAAGGDLSNLWMRGVGSIGGAAAKGGKDEFRMPVGGGMHSVLVRAGVNPSNDVMQAAGDVGKVQVSASIYGSSIIGAADPGTGTFEGIIIDPTEQYVGSVKKIKHGKGGGVANSLIVSKEAISGIEKVNVEPDTVVIIDGVVQ